MSVLPLSYPPQATAAGEGPFVGSIGVVNGDFGSLIYANTYPVAAPYSTYPWLVPVGAVTGGGSFIPGQALVQTAQGVVVGGTNFCYTYDYFTPLTGATVIVTQGYSIVAPAGTIAALTVSLPAQPYPGQVCHVSFSQVVTALTINAGTGTSPAGTATFIGTPITAAAVGTHITYMYEVTGNAWYPV